MDLTVKIKRYNPEKDTEPHWEEYKLEADPMDRALDLLNHIKWSVDGSLTFRKSCAHGICGSDAMQINGENKLACSILVQDLVGSNGGTISFAPLPAAPVIKDLVVDQTKFFDKYRAVMPWLINHTPPPEKERQQSQAPHMMHLVASSITACCACLHPEIQNLFLIFQ